MLFLSKISILFGIGRVELYARMRFLTDFNAALLLKNNNADSTPANDKLQLCRCNV